MPDKWVKGGWGTNNRTYAYPVSGVDGARAVGVTVSGYVNGDAKWVFDNVPVTAGQTYQFSDHYYSTQLTQILVTYVGVNSTPTYVLLAKLPSSVGTWQTYSGTFTVPTGVTFLTVTHVLNGNGTLSIDGVALVPDVATQTPVATQVPTPTPSPTTAVSTTTVSSVGNTVAIGKIPSWVKWGAYVGWQDTAMSEFETLVGKQPSMEMVFAHWGNDQFPSWYAPRIKEKGRTMVLFWEAIDYNRNYFTQPEYSFDSVLAGKQDAYFTKFALDAKNYGGEVVIIPYSEFNGDWFPWGGVVGNNTPEKYIAAYRYVHNFFINVPNVKFGWAVNADSVPDTAANQMELFYPGDAYVDIVGVDGFNSGVPTWMTFAQVFDNPLSRLKVYKKPIYIFSMGAAEDVRKPAWIIDGLGAQLALHPEVSGVLWFNENKQYNWLVNSSSAALSAFKAVLP